MTSYSPVSSARGVADPELGVGRARVAAQWRFGSTDLRDLLFTE
jgi:hypothetical protein